MQAPTDPEHASKAQDGPGYYQLNHTQCLLDALRGMTFVEYPVIDVMEKFYGTIVTPSGDRHAQEEPDSQRKRIKLDVKAGKKAINSLLSGYGSDEDEEEEEATTRNAMLTLGQYDDSDDELGSSGHDEEIQGEIDAAAVLELIKSARGEMGLQIDDGEDDVDWGESDVEDEPV
ncbi:hypothetical protein ONZ45_g15635 [Pleurotus djamor]|nr:hypothetical protein ONZ45_g15635 [Pleurotus djamor]